MKSIYSALLVALLGVCAFVDSSNAQGTAFTYQGQLLINGFPAEGIYDLEFYVRDAPSAGNPVGATNTQPTVAISNGLFTVVLDFGPGVFTGSPRWLEIGARTNGSVSAYTILAPRQEITPAPYAVFSPNAGTAATAQSVSSGAISAPQLNTAAAPAAGQVLAYTDTGMVWTNPAAGGEWLLSGNSGTTPATQYLGTSDGQPLQIKATGGINFSTGTNRVSLAGQPGLDFGNTPRQMINLYQSSNAIGVQNFTTYFRSPSDFSWHMGGSHTNLQNEPGPGGYEMMRLDGNGDLNVRRNVIANSITLSSDRTLKENFEPMSPLEVLDKVVALPISFWNFKQAANERHLGPTAQDFFSTFGLGGDDRHIAVVDEGGVALAAIQGVDQKLREKDAQIQQLTEQVAELARAVRALQAASTKSDGQ